MTATALPLVLAAAFITVECTMTDPPAPSTCRQGPVKTFDPLSQPKETTPRAPFLDPTALHGDQAYLVRPVEKEANGTQRSAEFIGGQAAMVSYLKENVLLHVYPGIGWLKHPIVHFTIDAQGAPAQVELVATSGNVGLDVALVRIFNDMPRWEPAVDAQGQAMAQSFEFVVGKGGC